MSDEIETIENTEIETTVGSTPEQVETESSAELDTKSQLFGKKTVPDAIKTDHTPKNFTQKLKTDTPETKIAPPAYTPNYKFKVLDQEKEMDEWIRPFVKTKDEEEKFRDLLTKAHGLQKIKSERDQVRNEFEQFRGQFSKQHEPVIQQHQFLSQVANQSRNDGNWGRFFQAAQIPVQSVIRWAADTVAQLEKNPQHLQQEENSWQQTQQFRNLQTEVSTLKQRAERAQMERQELDLDYTLRNPEIQNFRQNFEDRVGTPNALKQEIIRRGALIEMTERRVASAQEILGDIMKYYGTQSGAVQSPQAELLPEGTPEVIKGSEGKPVLPTIKGRSGSPTRKVFKSTDELRKHFAENAKAS